MALNRALHPLDFEVLESTFKKFAAFERDLYGVPYRKDHVRRYWEYGNILYQLDSLRIAFDSPILEAAADGSFFPIFLKARTPYVDVTVTDSFNHGDGTPIIVSQLNHLKLNLPIIFAPTHSLVIVRDKAFTVTICVSELGYTSTDRFVRTLQELVRVTKLGGYIFLTADFYENEDQARRDPACPVTPFTPELACSLPEIIYSNTRNSEVVFVGGTDFQYHALPDNPPNSLVNICLQRIL